MFKTRRKSSCEPAEQPIVPPALAMNPRAQGFSLANALYLAHASDIAYHRSPSSAAGERLALEASPFRSKLTRMRGFLGVCPTHAVLAFRGSDPVTLPNWLTDAVVRLVEHEHYIGRVHHGFSAVLNRTWDKIQVMVEQAGDKPLFLTGHSMGGALAVLAACRLARLGRPPAGVYTFGAPRVGDRTFCAAYRVPTYRVVNRLDIVPEMPLASVKRLLPARPRFTSAAILGTLKRLAQRARCYGHVKTLVYIDMDGRVIEGADVQPWHAHAVARAIATRGRSFHEGVTDHLLSSYMRGLQGLAEPRDAIVRRILPPRERRVRVE